MLQCITVIMASEKGSHIVFTWTFLHFLMLPAAVAAKLLFQFKSDLEYSANALSLHAFIPKASSRPLGMGLPRAAWVKLNRLRSGVGRFCSSMYKWGLAPLANCECGASEQTADHIISQCPIHRAPRGMFGLIVLDDETRCWLKSLTVSSLVARVVKG